jgi:hypothetical protein
MVFMVVSYPLWAIGSVLIGGNDRFIYGRTNEGRRLAAKTFPWRQRDPCNPRPSRIHQTLRVTPAMKAGISDEVWGLEEIAGL